MCFQALLVLQHHHFSLDAASDRACAYVCVCDVCLGMSVCVHVPQSATDYFENELNVCPAGVHHEIEAAVRR